MSSFTSHWGGSVTRSLPRYLLAAVILLSGPFWDGIDIRANGSSMLSQDGYIADGLKREVYLTKSKSIVLDFDGTIRDLLVADASIADAIVRTDRRIYLFGKEYGTTNITAFGPDGAAVAEVQIIIQPDVTALQKLLHRILPDSEIIVEAASGNVVLRGAVNNPEDSVIASKVTAKFLGVTIDEVDASLSPGIITARERSGIQVLNLIKIRGKDQVLLRVTIAELQREGTKQLGIDLTLAGAVDAVAANIGSSLSSANVSPVVNGSVTLSTSNNYATIKMLEEQGLMKTLAEPQLTTISGEQAQFLVGGEFPIKSSSEGESSVTFKSFGIKLSFVPVVLSEGRISIKMSTEVSSIDSSVISEGVPGTKTRKASTTLELPSGGMMVLAGLLQDEVSNNYSGIPWLMDIPILGALFRSNSFKKRQSELAIFVQPIIVRAVSRNELQKPGQNMQAASDVERVFLNRLNRTYPGRVRAFRGPRTTHRRRYGYVFN